MLWISKDIEFIRQDANPPLRGEVLQALGEVPCHVRDQQTGKAPCTLSCPSVSKAAAPPTTAGLEPLVTPCCQGARALGAWDPSKSGMHAPVHSLLGSPLACCCRRSRSAGRLASSHEALHPSPSPSPDLLSFLCPLHVLALRIRRVGVV